MANLQELIARRSELQAELKCVGEAIAAFADASPVKIGTRRNLRNTRRVTTDPEWAREWAAEEPTEPGLLLVFADSNLSTPADQFNHEGWVVRSAWAQFQMDYPDMIGDDIWEE
jgi:hypothetical protein